MVLGRPARTLVLPAPQNPDGLTIAPTRRSDECRSADAFISDKGKVERPFRYIREDFFLGGVFRNLDDLNEQLCRWLDTVANPRVHATTNRVVNEAFAEEKASLKARA
jgi:hypothetical protein